MFPGRTYGAESADPGVLLLSTDLSCGNLDFRNYRLRTLYRAAELIALPEINRMAVIERPIVGIPRA